MRVLSWDRFIGSRPLRETSVAMTIGVFDGVHRGHQTLIQQIQDAGMEESIVLTFRYNPRFFLKPHLFPGDITTQRQKLDILSMIGVSTVILIDFSNDFSKLTGKEFLMRIRQSCDLRYLALGDNFRCGFQGKTSAYDVRKILEEAGIDVHIAQSVTRGGATISSTRIRAALSEGDLGEATSMMGRNFTLDLTDIPQNEEVPNRSVEKMALHQVVPPHGTYPVEIHTTTRTFPSDAVIDQECLRWKHDGGEEAVCIEFHETNR